MFIIWVSFHIKLNHPRTESLMPELNEFAVHELANHKPKMVKFDIVWIRNVCDFGRLTITINLII